MRCLMSILAAIWLAATLIAADLNRNGAVDWEQYRVTAEGVGIFPANVDNPAQAEAMAFRAAKLDALRNLLEAVNLIQLSSQTAVRDMVLESDVVKTRVAGLVRNAQQIGESRISTDGKVTVIFGMPLKGNLADALLPEAGFGFGAGASLSADVVSGLIVDVSGLGFMPSLLPRILDENGNVVYGPQAVSRQYAVETGIVGYCKTMEQARANERVGARPMTLKARRVTGDKKCDVVLSDGDADAIREAAKTQGFLSDCRVLFVVD